MEKQSDFRLRILDAPSPENEFTLKEELTTLGRAPENDIVISLFQMQENDVIICASDGRDDMVVEAQDGSRKIIFDEKLFLQWVEKGNALVK